MVRRTLKRGKGAICSILLAHIHPSLHIRDKYPNRARQERLEGCEILRQEEKLIQRKRTLAVVFRHESFPDIELYCVTRFAKVTKEGDKDFFFDAVGDTIGVGAGAEAEGVEILHETPAFLFNNFRADDPQLSNAVDAGLVTVDDDNDPAPENIPVPGIPSISGSITYSENWGHDGICFRTSIGASNSKARLKNHERHLKLTKLQIFEILFPTQWVKDVLLPETSKKLSARLSYGEYLQFVGMWLLISTTVGFERRDFWAKKKDNDRDTPFKFNEIMSRHRFKEILKELNYTNENKPLYPDKFWEVRQMLDAFNDNMEKEFIPSWVSCLDESMSKWLNKYTCPGFMVVPRKPWPCGNEYHTICCSESGVLFALELVEGKDEPAQRPRKEHNEKGKTLGLMIRLTKSVHGTGKLVIMDSGFCVLQGIIELRKLGVFSSALIKKRRYWPKYVHGDEFKAQFDHCEPGTFKALRGKLDGIDFHLYGMKEPDYILMFMTTYGSENRKGKEQKRKYVNHQGVESTVRFKYPEVCHNHYAHRDSVDNHNGRRMYPIALEEQWKTHRWPNRCFQFIVGVTEVNANLLSHAVFDEPLLEQTDYRYQLANELINNPYVGLIDSPARKRKANAASSVHQIMTLPPYRTFTGTQIKKCKTRYIQLQCECSKKVRVRTYCKCSPGTIRCTNCFANHVLDSQL